MQHSRIFKDGENYELIFDTIESYDDFDILLDFFERQYKAKIYDKLKGPESRSAYVIINKKKLRLGNNPDGNSLHGSYEDLEILEAVQKDIEEYLNSF